MITEIKTYSEMCMYRTFEERFKYLQLHGTVAHDTFGFDRHLNQTFYMSPEWKRARDIVIIRDNGCDLGVPGREIHTKLLIHHINPMRPEDIIHGESWIVDPEYLITTTHDTHNAIHYGDLDMTPKIVLERTPGDTKLW